MWSVVNMVDVVHDVVRCSNFPLSVVDVVFDHIFPKIRGPEVTHGQCGSFFPPPGKYLSKVPLERSWSQLESRRFL